MMAYNLSAEEFEELKRFLEKERDRYDPCSNRQQRASFATDSSPWSRIFRIVGKSSSPAIAASTHSRFPNGARFREGDGLPETAIGSFRPDRG